MDSSLIKVEYLSGGGFTRATAPDGSSGVGATEADALSELYVTLKTRVEDEHLKRAWQKDTSEYIAIAKQIEELQAKQKALSDAIPDSSEALSECKELLMAEMKDNALDRAGSVIARYKKLKEVKMGKLLHVLGGDIDALLSVATVPQTRLADFASGYSPDLKKAILGCVEVVKTELVDLVLDTDA